jgi:hypothetical protein
MDGWRRGPPVKTVLRPLPPRFEPIARILRIGGRDRGERGRADQSQGSQTNPQMRTEHDPQSSAADRCRHCEE